MRMIRLYGKKRGARRTGSRLAASLGEAVFFGVLFLLGLIALTVLVTLRVADPQLDVFRPGFGFWLLVLVSTSFVVIGGAGVLYGLLETRASAERRSAMAKQAAGIEFLRDALPPEQEYPTLPRDLRLTDSPGIALAYRLPIVRSPSWKLAVVMACCLVVTGFATALVVITVRGMLLGELDLVLLALTVPIVLAGGWSIYYFFRQMWVSSRIGPTCLEISDLPLRPGEQYGIVLSQAGRFSLASLEMALVCEEEATYRQGTDIRTETRVVYEQQIFSRRQMKVVPGTPLEIEERLSVPADAMHSFQSGHNTVRWKLVVSGKPAHWPEFVRSFPLIIYPSTNGTRGVEAF